MHIYFFSLIHILTDNLIYFVGIGLFFSDAGTKSDIIQCLLGIFHIHAHNTDHLYLAFICCFILCDVTVCLRRTLKYTKCICNKHQCQNTDDDRCHNCQDRCDPFHFRIHIVILVFFLIVIFIRFVQSFFHNRFIFTADLFLSDRLFRLFLLFLVFGGI